MAKHVLTNVRLFAGGCDLTGASNKLELSGEFEEKDATVWPVADSQTTIGKQYLAGLFGAKISASGLWEAGDASLVDNEMYADRGGTQVWTACPQGSAVGNVAYSMSALHASYQLLGGVGDVAPWQASMTGTGWLVRGYVAHPATTIRTATGFGGPGSVELPAVAAGQYLYAALHVLSVSGTSTPTLTVAVETDSDADFNTPTTRTTFAAATAVGGQFARVAGPITDTFAQVTWTISGTDPGFQFLVALAVA